MEQIDEIGPVGPLTPTADPAEWSPPPPPLPSAPPPFLWENPNWGFPTGILVWLASMVLLVLMSTLFALPFLLRYFSSGHMPPDISALLLADPRFLVWQVAAALPAHALTLLIIWAVVTRFGKLPFWRSVSWGWGDRRNLIAVAGGVVAAVVLLYLSILVQRKIGGGETMIDKLVESSKAARYLLAFLAAISAPFVEELIYRGVLYPATQRSAARIGRYFLPGPAHQDSLQIGGAIVAVLFVAALFAGVHVAQYSNSLGVIAAISMLSLVLTGARAITGRVMPGFMIHFAFNGIQALGLIYLPHLEKEITPPAPTAAALVQLLHHLPFLG